MSGRRGAAPVRAVKPGWKLGLVGHPVSHSRSPALHHAALRSAALEGRYDLFDVQEPGLPAMIEGLRAGTTDGLNVTVPHKESVAHLCDVTRSEAAALGAVNTVVRARDGTIEGHNTDVSGLVMAVQSRWPEQRWRGAPVCIIGAGGAARAAVLAAARLGAGEVRVVNRTHARARRMVESLRDVGAPLEASGSLVDGCRDAGLVLQATSLGMGAGEGSEVWDEVRRRAEPALSMLRDGACLMDLVYSPRRTAWMAAADELGIASSDGLEMLVRQAAAAFTLWTSVPADVDAMRAAVS